MVFSSIEFIIFLFVVVNIYYLLNYLKLSQYNFLFLFLASLFFYGSWNDKYIFLILGSLLVNFYIGKAVSCLKFKKFFIWIGILFNVGLLGYFKYTDFFIQTINDVAHYTLPLQHIVLPIGISFFTFQQIAYLADIYTGKHNSEGEGILSYSLFVTFFPQLVAGPIVHHTEMIPQFENELTYKVDWKNIYNGIFLFSIGLFKKVMIADSLSSIVGMSFDQIPVLSFVDAVIASLSYTLQLYFDFSGYSDMAVGIALLFNIHLPWNFNSPYQSRSIQEFWRRWHITLSRWLAQYIYIYIGGNRKGLVRTCINLFITFLVGGLWHGAAWTFVLWGALHGLALVVHRIWKHFSFKINTYLAWFLTFAFVNFSWIVFRAQDFKAIDKFLDAFCLENGFGLSSTYSVLLRTVTGMPSKGIVLIFIAVCLFLTLFFKNSQFYLSKSNSKLLYSLQLICFSISIIFTIIINKSSEFLYFQF